MIVWVRQLKRKKEDEEGDDEMMKEKQKERREGFRQIFGQPVSVAL
jgi:hypothetical protein